jgi:hypothetical protein
VSQEGSIDGDGNLEETRDIGDHAMPMIILSATPVCHMLFVLFQISPLYHTPNAAIQCKMEIQPNIEKIPPSHRSSSSD